MVALLRLAAAGVDGLTILPYAKLFGKDGLFDPNRVDESGFVVCAIDMAE